MIIRNISCILLLFFLNNSCINKPRKIESVTNEIPLKDILPSKEDVIYRGNIQFSTQLEIDDFKKGGYTFIDGNVTISSKDFEDNYTIENVNSFNKLKSINGNLSLIHLKKMNSLDGFKNLEIVNGDFSFSSNYSEQEKLFNSLEKINGNIYLGTNNKNFEGLNSFKTANNLYLVGIDSKKFNAFKKLKTVNKIYFSNSSVDSLICFQNLQKVKTDITFEYSSNLRYINLPKLEEVGGIFGFTDVPNFENLEIPNIKKIYTLLIFVDNDNWKKHCYITKYLKENKIEVLDFRGTLLNIHKKDFILECE